MTGPLLIEALGHQFSVDVADLPAAQVAALREQWARCRPSRPGEQDEPVSVPRSTLEDPVRRDYALSSAVTFSAIRQAAGSGIMLHACGVARPETGQVAVLVAPSGTGKTTAAARLCAHDFGYVTDETVLVRPDGSVLPYPKPLSVVLESDDPYHKKQHGPDELQLRIPPDRLEAAALVLLDRIGRAERDPGEPEPAGVPGLQPLGLIDTMMRLIPQTSSLTALEHPLGSLAELVVSLGGGHVLHYRDIEDTTVLIGQLLDAGPAADRFEILTHDSVDAAPGADQWIGPLDHPGGYGELAGDRVVVRAPFQEAVAADDEVLVLNDSMPLRLTGLGATIWLTADRPATVDELMDRCVSVHGDHPQAAELVRAAVGELLGADALLLRRVPVSV